ncbi:MAG TPA: M20/M25/M40 family metallo-hydrolase [Solirubrobacteraceae bacterium]|nr:M20/M25/M40 family metallo-hydrolase [Solirubrobacteraceae bacterium]
MTDAWVAEHARRIAARAERELEALVAVSSPSGDVHGAEEAIAVASALLPEEAQVERVPCSSPDHADDLIARVRGTGTRRIVLLGHLDTVVAHDAHRSLRREEGRLVGSGSIDMKAGDVLALGVLRALVAEPHRFAEAALVLVVDEEWRIGPFAHTDRFAGWDACLCFEAGQHTPGGHDAVVVRRKAAGTLRVEAYGRSAHSGSAPQRGRNALLALADAARRIAELHDPEGEQRLTAVPTVMRSGDAFNVVPAHGALTCDLRADELRAFDAVLGAIPEEVDDVRLEPVLQRQWPGMDAREVTADLLAAAGERLGRPIVGADRGGASDASYFAAVIPLTVDGLGPRGGGAHAPHEYVDAASLHPRAEVALALVAALTTD